MNGDGSRSTPGAEGRLVTNELSRAIFGGSTGKGGGGIAGSPLRGAAGRLLE